MKFGGKADACLRQFTGKAMLISVQVLKFARSERTFCGRVWIRYEDGLQTSHNLLSLRLPVWLNNWQP
jgi:hypothetical protein